MKALASVPDQIWATRYVSRRVAGALFEFDIYDSALANHENILITGPAGSGKTMSVMAFAAKRSLPYYNVSSNGGAEPSQLLGKWNPDTNGHFRWQDGPVTELVKTGGVLLINEANFMPEHVKPVMFSLTDHRREIQLMDKDGEVIKAHPNLLIVADMNPGYRGTKPLNEAEKDRYQHKLDFQYDTEVEKQVIKYPSLLELAKKLRIQHEKKAILTPISTRALAAFVDNSRSLGLGYAIYAFVNGFTDAEKPAIRMALNDTMYANLERDKEEDDNRDI